MELDHETQYRALAAKDSRFDGLFFVGVKSTGIYCRPVCTARTPKVDRCAFYSSAALAEKQGYRPCLRCRPELAPGLSPIDSAQTVARTAAARIEAGDLSNGSSVEDLASALCISSRQLRRVMQAELGVGPLELAQTRRLLLAKQLLTESTLPMAQVAFASGFESLRRFNASFRGQYRLTPTEMRRGSQPAPTADALRLSLAYRPPLAWEPLLAFLAGRATAGVEWIDNNRYLRTVEVGSHKGWLSVEPASERNGLVVEVSMSLVPVLPQVLGRVRHLFDLNAFPDRIAEGLRADERLRGCIERTPGMRVPGSFDGFQVAIRGIIGQRVSIAAASTVAGRLTQEFGEAIETPFPQLSRLSPTAETLARVTMADLKRLGLSGHRGLAIQSLSRAVAEGVLSLAIGPSYDDVMQSLVKLEGIGPWTSNYIGMRVLGWPDAFPSGDLILARSAGVGSARELERLSEAWSPWRSYAAMYLWHDCGTARPSEGAMT